MKSKEQKEESEKLSTLRERGKITGKRLQYRCVSRDEKSISKLCTRVYRYLERSI